MAGGKRTLRFGPCDPSTFVPDLDWLQGQLNGANPPKLVYVVNPCNPTGESAGADSMEVCCTPLQRQLPADAAIYCCIALRSSCQTCALSAEDSAEPA